MNDSFSQPLTLTDLIHQFSLCGIARGQRVSVHTSLSKIGMVLGGAESVIRSLLHLVGEEGTLMMPSQTWKNLDPATGVHWDIPEQYWQLIRDNWPAYDPAVTPAIGMGIVAEMFRSWPGAKRSNHPARSFAAVGKDAAHLTSDHDLENIFGEGSPLAKLYALDGYILLIGVKHDKNTSLHLAEMRADFPGKKTAEESSAMLINGKREWVHYRTAAVEDADFVQLGEEFESEHDLPVYKVGNAEVRFMRQRILVDWAVQWMEKNRK